MFANPEELLRYLKNEDVKFVDVRFCDLPGVMQHFNLPVESVDDDFFTNGLAFDGSSIRGFQAIHESDMLLLPDVATAFIDPFRAQKTLALNFFIHDPFTREAYSRDPRNVAKKAEAYLAASGIADTAYFGPEAEFYIFDSIRHETSAHQAYYYIDSIEGAWNTGREEEGGNRGYKTAYKGGYFPVPPVDHYADLRDQIVRRLIDTGFTVERSHHEVGTAGQAEINYKFSTLLHAGDQLQLFKYIVKNTAWAAGKTATFMPKPLFGDNGSGMHTHQSLWLGGEPLFYDETGYAGLSDTARWYIGGLLHHAPSLLAFTNPTVNSYRRLVPGFEAPVNLVYSQRNRSACTRIPVTGSNPKAKRVEFRVPDPSANVYLAFSAMLMAGLDGIKSKIEPPAPIDKDLYDLPPEEWGDVKQVPGSLPAVLDSLEADHDYLLDGGVFTPDLISTWIDWKRANEVDPVRLRPTPHEFAMYFDC
ncbi:MULTISPECIES: type I glutamate--ammonia ligase [Micromonospora]|uniref:Glutamine synthetase n=1 Tax=Verrucosispora sioxanthis TaxID=2499994 RepID=A0A6M1LAY6_9ACTN|nr:MULTISPECIES: type I glutamate--ammonia ligase [Micromonospora]MBQ1025498.1 type I glutamate--ammonia ligase [Micromonospora sp. C95]MCZ7418240.1 type I glutamate--ammonia ligase [Verrucosispora sp. WMMA2121]NEE66313.1 type I glutamate--ammonia ligase [Verrucosispora sioxanthis]NGM15423.1 type I glutamate--ammonia ligase [Verrucosispora sioxanthis]WBB49823.1 type I glutamate--ammonia ligase [Verrucosispora sp. WMMA2044]